MIYFKTKINNSNQIISSLIEGVMSINLSYVIDKNGNELNLIIGGLHSIERQHLDWLNYIPKDNDRIIVEIVDELEGNNSHLVKIRKQEVIHDVIVQAKLKSFHMLKKELEQLGLL